ncbi:MAG: helix-turn-helix domain-containing protein [Bacteroidales bacterium]|nr:helix-turn-helix domain-containing protein [Bacteroidales bacterium]
MEDIKWMTDKALMERIGLKIREWRLEMNYSQKSLAFNAGISLPTEQKLEKGGSVSLDILLRVLRTLDRLDALGAFTAEREISPIEIQKMSESYKPRRRASKKLVDGYLEDSPLW